jgi:hypothetical protein
VEPVVSLDLDVAVAADDLLSAEAALTRQFKVEWFPHRVNVSAPGSDLRVQLQTNPRYAAIVARADISRLLEARPDLRVTLPKEILDKLL